MKTSFHSSMYKQTIFEVYLSNRMMQIFIKYIIS